MKRITLIPLLILCAAQIASAQEWAKAILEKSPRHREWVTVKHDGRSVETFVVYPESMGKTPVVLIIHEIFGMTDWVQDLADQVAAAGYIAVAPDLLSGMGPNGGRRQSPESRSGDGGFEWRGGLCTQTSSREWQALRWWLLLGRQSNFPVRY